MHGEQIGVKLKFHKLEEFYKSLNIDQYQNGIVYFLGDLCIFFSSFFFTSRCIKRSTDVYGIE